MSFDLKVENGDLAIGEDGDLKKVEDSEKLIQDILKIAITPLGSNRYCPAYGSPISASLIGMVLDDEMMLTVASNQLKNSLETLQKLQKQQFSSQHVSAAEQLAAIKDASIYRDQVDPTQFRVFIEVLSRELTVVRTSYEVSATL